MHEPNARFEKRLLKFAILILFFCGANGASQAAESNSPLKNVSQLVLVTTHDWDSVPGTMQCFERADDKSPWHEVGEKFPIVVGRHGLGCGRGLHHPEDFSGPLKKEGDGKSPAGIFRLTSAFGLAEPEKMKDLKLPYLHLRDVIECVDDVKSAHYNSIVDRDKVSKVDWDSSEKMKAIGEAYRLGVFVEHNTESLRQAGGGSCIFLHIWKDSETGTSGCTAMVPEKIENLVRWLDASKTPTLVQLPEPDFQRLKTRWNLPAVKK